MGLQVVMMSVFQVFKLAAVLSFCSRRVPDFSNTEMLNLP